MNEEFQNLDYIKEFFINSSVEISLTNFLTAIFISTLLAYIIKKVYKIIYLSKFNVRQSISNIKKTLKETDEINNILRFINESERGLI